MNIQELESLSYSTIIMVAVGYVSYLITFRTFQETEKHTLYKIFIFSAISILTYKLTTTKYHINYILMVGLPLFIAWVLTLNNHAILRHTLYSIDDGRDNIFLSINSNKNLIFTQLEITLKDGTKLYSNYPTNYNGSPQKLPLIDKFGNISLYVDAIKELGKKEVEYENTKYEESKNDPNPSYNITCIPKEEIKLYEFRVIKK